METIKTKGLNPVSEESTVINVFDHFLPKQSSSYYITLMLWKKANESWTNNELIPIKKIFYSKNKSVTVLFLNNEKKVICFK